MKRLGKKRLRPGGKAGTDFLLSHLLLKKGQKVLEIACNRGLNLLSLAKQYPEVSFVGVDIDKDSIEEAKVLQAKEGLHNVEFMQANAFHLPFSDASFDFVINEAMLTMLSEEAKKKALSEYHRVLKKGGLLLTHDIALISMRPDTRKLLSQTIHLSVHPLQQSDWQAIFQGQGFSLNAYTRGALSLMSLGGMLKDEGFCNTLRILKNALKKENRAYFFRMRSTFSKLKKDMQFICFVHQKV